ncbi:hypothetical protein [Moorena sp. SIO3H5]|nr:hypothetical protein [Moorena sp. SIO3H5]NEO73987.1 hypothetical protein [Moorena sp. SIO3H5]
MPNIKSGGIPIIKERVGGVGRWGDGEVGRWGDREIFIQGNYPDMR